MPHLQLSSQCLHFLAQFPDDLGVGVFVDDGVVDDPLGSVRVPQGGQRLLVVVGRRGHRGHHDCATVASEVVLELWHGLGI